MSRCFRRESLPSIMTAAGFASADTCSEGASVLGFSAFFLLCRSLGLG